MKSNNIIYIKHKQSKRGKNAQHKYTKFEYPKLALAPTFMGKGPNGVCSQKWFPCFFCDKEQFDNVGTAGD